MASTNSTLKASSSSSSSEIPTWKYHVFFSFCVRDNRAFIGNFRRVLESNGIILFDPTRQEGHIFKAIKESLHAVVVISKNYASSGRCLEEFSEIMECKREGRMRVFPVFYYLDPSEVPNLTKGDETSFHFSRESEVFVRQLNLWAAALREEADCSGDPPDTKQKASSVGAFARRGRATLTEAGHIVGWHLYMRSKQTIIVDLPYIEKQEVSFAKSSARSKEDPQDEEDEDRRNEEEAQTTWRVASFETDLLPRSEQTIIDEVCATVCGCLRHSPVPQFIVGMDDPVEKMEILLHLESDDALFVGICGMPGIGKTTLARVVYEKFSHQFQAKCFIASIGKASGRDVASLQKYLFSTIMTESEANRLNDWDDVSEGIKLLNSSLGTINVLIVLDDVRQSEQVKALAGSLSWFGKKSRIVLTSRNYSLLESFCEHNIYEVKVLDCCGAGQLFCLKAFNRLLPPVEFEGLVQDILEFAAGLPLALQALGSYLYNQEEHSIWESFLIRLKANHDEDIVGIRKITFDELQDLAQRAFLDIICFFWRQSKNDVTHSLRCLGYPSESILQDLEDKYFIRFGYDEELIIHNVLTQMGHGIIKHAGLWSTEDIITVLREKNVPKAIRGILLKFHPRKPERLCYDAFSSMEELQLLEINIPEGLIWSDSYGFIELKWCGNPLKFSLSNKLCVLRWDQYPLELLPLSFEPTNLVELKLRRSSIKTLWGDTKRFHKLRNIDLNCSKELTEIPDFSDIPNLERLDLSNCSNLSSVHPSIGFLQRLIEMSLRNCFRLRHLPNTFRLPSLTSLDLCGCSRRKRFPRGARNLTSLRTLKLSNTGIKRLSTSFTRLSSLEDLYISGHCFSEKMTIDLPDHKSSDIGRYRPSGELTYARSVILRNWSSGLSSLKKLDLSYRNLECEALPKSFGFLSSLKYLNVSGNKFKTIPDGICQLSGLRYLLLNNCGNLKCLWGLPFGLRHLHLGNCPLLERFYIDFNAWPSLESSRPCEWLATYFGDNGKSYSCLNLHPGSTVWNNDGEECDIRPEKVAWGRSSVSEIPRWFIRKSTNVSGGVLIREPLGYKSDTWEGHALFIVYEVLSPDADLSFDCWLQVDENGTGSPLRLFTDERSPAGRNGVWMYIPSRQFLESMGTPVTWEKNLSPSIAITSKTMALKEWGWRVVSRGEVSFFLRSFSSISPHDSNVEGIWKKVFRSLENHYLSVHGPC